MKKPRVAEEAMGRAHASLLDDLRKIERTFCRDSPASPAQARNELLAARALVGEHFRFEEQSGWKDEILRREPRFGHALRRLVEEHNQLKKSLEILIEEAREVETFDETLREKVRHWLDRVREHEAHEDEVLEESFVEDLGAGD
jgi:hypothetical protein